MAFHRATLSLIERAKAILQEYSPQTVRQCFYRLVSLQLVENTLNQYKRVGRMLADARKDGLIPWEHIEDRLRRPRHVSMWSDLPDFAETACAAYRRNVWGSQPCYIECWCEKDALSGIFEDVLDPYGMTLNVGRGYDSVSSIYNAALRFNAIQDKPIVVLYFGDFDPSGEDMHRSLIDRLADFGSRLEIPKVALTYEDIGRYNLPPNFTKATDTRREKFVAKYGDVSVELDALPVNVLRDRIRSEIEKRMDLDALALTRETEEEERARIRQSLTAA